MKQVVYFIVCSLLLCTNSIYAQQSIDDMFEEAKALNDRKEFYKAAKLFSQLQSVAYKAGDYKTFILSITAEGECYYMLDLATDLQEVLGKAHEAYSNHSAQFDEASRLWLKEAILKLEGAYCYTMLDFEEGAAQKSEKAYKACLQLLDSIKYIPGSTFDDSEAETIIHRELLSLYYKQKQYEKALEESDFVYYYWVDMGYDSRDASPKGQRDYYSFVDASVSRAMVLARLRRFEEANAVLSELPEECNDEASVLRTKGKILLLEHAFGGTDNRYKAKIYYSHYLDKMKNGMKKELAVLDDEKQTQYWLAIHDFLNDCYLLGDYAPDMLYNEALFSKGFLLEFQRENNSAQCRWTGVKNALKRGECAIEFVQYKDKNDEKSLAALVLKRGSALPQFIEIAPLSSITDTVLRNGQTIGAAVSNDIGASKDVLYSDTTVCNIIWNKELLNAIGDCEKIYFAPDGILHQLAIEYIYPNQRVALRRLTSTRLLIERRGMQTSLNNMLLCGGIDYNTGVQAMRRGNDTQGFFNLKKSPTYINNLDGTADEVNTIYSLRGGNGVHNDTILSGADATDEKFIALLKKRYSAVHLATHGYFAGENNFSDVKPLYRDHAMSESGLMMAGAGYNLNAEEFDPEYSDGIITAKELSATDLSGVNLVVLSACQTGLGYLTADGVYGIQRALKIAGAKAMIVSLWSVDDVATAEFMKLFYSELEKDTSATPDVYKAFNTARLSLANSGKSSSRRFDPKSLTTKEISRSITSPRYSNAFILIDVL